MKKISLLLVLFIIFSCQKNDFDGFLLKGNIKGLKNSSLLVLKFVGDNMEIDSILVSNNQFEYSGKVEEPYFVQLLIKDGNSTKGKLTEFMLENSKIEIKGNSIDFDSVKVTGSNSDKTLKKYFAEDNLLNDKWNKLKVDYDKFDVENDTINRKKIAKQLNKIIQVDKINLLKKYVRENSNSKIGALIPNFCTIENQLNENDWKEIYEYLTPEIKETGYGKRILKKIESNN